MIIAIIILSAMSESLDWVWVMWTLTGGHRWTWEAWVTGCCHPQPVSRFGYSRLAKVRSQQLVPGGASISLTSQCASPLTASPVDYFMSRLAPCPPPPLPLPVCLKSTNPLAVRLGERSSHAAAYAVGATATDKNSQDELQGYAQWINFSNAFPHTGQAGNVDLQSCAM